MHAFACICVQACIGVFVYVFYCVCLFVLRPYVVYVCVRRFLCAFSVCITMNAVFFYLHVSDQYFGFCMSFQVGPCV